MYPQRKTIRLPHYDYSSPGMYFLTICTHERESLFGAIDAGHVVLNAAGEITEKTWRALPNRFPNLETDTFILMPNHVHAILFLYNSRSCPNPGAASGAPTTPTSTARAINHASAFRPTLAAIVRAFKSESAIAINKLHMTPGAPVWQRNYFEHIIRTPQSLDNLRRYIHENPARWATDDDFALSFSRHFPT